MLSRELAVAVDGSELPLWDSVAAAFTGRGGVLIHNRSSLPTIPMLQVYFINLQLLHDFSIQIQ